MKLVTVSVAELFSRSEIKGEGHNEVKCTFPEVAVLTCKALNGLAPPYPSSAFTHVADMPSRRRLRSTSTDQLLVPSYRRSTIGRRAFPIAAAGIWNDLPFDVTSAPSLAVSANITIFQPIDPASSVWAASYSVLNCLDWHWSSWRFCFTFLQVRYSLISQKNSQLYF